MAIEGPKTIDGAPAGETAKESFLVFPRGMPALAGRGRKLDDAVAPQAIEAQLVFGQISPIEEAGWERTGYRESSGRLWRPPYAMETAPRISGVNQPSVRVERLRISIQAPAKMPMVFALLGCRALLGKIQRQRGGMRSDVTLDRVPHRARHIRYEAGYLPLWMTAQVAQ